MTKELIQLASDMNNEMAELKTILASIEKELKRIDQEESFEPYIKQMKNKFDEISVQMFKYTQSDQIIQVFPFIRERIEEIKKGTNIEFNLYGEEEFIIRTSNQKLFTFFKVVLLLGIKVDSSSIRIYQTKNSLLIKQNGTSTNSVPFENNDPLLIPSEDDQITKLLTAIRKFSKQCHLDFSIKKMVSEKGFKLHFTR
jgi:hypothetical protein